MMTPAIRQKAVKAIEYLEKGIEQAKDVDSSIIQHLDVLQGAGSKGNVYQIGIIQNNVQIQVHIGLALEKLNEIIAVKPEPTKTIEELIDDACNLAYGQGRTWKWLAGEVSKRYAKVAERHYRTLEGASAAIDMDRTTFRKYTGEE